MVTIQKKKIVSKVLRNYNLIQFYDRYEQEMGECGRMKEGGKIRMAETVVEEKMYVNGKTRKTYFIEIFVGVKGRAAKGWKRMAGGGRAAKTCIDYSLRTFIIQKNANR